MILNMSGGGSNPLNFKIVGNPQPENPKVNTIWVNTDVPIPTCVLAPPFPGEAPPVEEGTVWIVTGDSYDAAFNALKKDTIMVCPVGAMQYVSGAWVDLDAYLYNGAEWVQFSTARLFLYNKGDKCEAITGGWGTSGYSHRSYSLRNPTFNSTSVTIASNNATNAGAAGTLNAVDLTDIKSIKINFTAVSHYAYVYISNTKANPDSNAAAEVSANSKGEYSLNVSSLKGKYYIFIITFGSTQAPSTSATYDWIEMFR